MKYFILFFLSSFFPYRFLRVVSRAVARGPRCPTSGVYRRRRRCIFRARRMPTTTAAAGDTRAHASHRSVCSTVAEVVVNDLLVITRPHRTQLYLPTQSISQGTTTHAEPVAPHRRPASRAAILRTDNDCCKSHAFYKIHHIIHALLIIYY